MYILFEQMTQVWAYFLFCFGFLLINFNKIPYCFNIFLKALF